jgi:ribosome-associated heat shock protein Hsp15
LAPAGSAASTSAAAPDGRLRLDKWLWQARFFRSRSLAAAAVASGHLRVNGTPVSRPGRDIVAGDTLTFPQGNRIRLIRVLALGTRRGPAPEAQALYLDLDPPPAAANPLE